MNQAQAKRIRAKIIIVNNRMKKDLVELNTYETKYSTVTIEGHKIVDNTGCVQVNSGVSKRTGEAYREHIHCDGTGDFSRHDGIKYDSKCYFCYAGVGHTRNRHNKAISK